MEIKLIIPEGVLDQERAEDVAMNLAALTSTLLGTMVRAAVVDDDPFEDAESLEELEELDEGNPDDDEDEIDGHVELDDIPF